MSKVVIKAEDISKQYRLGLVGTGTVKDDMKRWWYNVRGKEDPFLKIGEANNRAVKGESDYVWSLRDINFEINQGDSVGIIGRNGAGKSTLLKILSQVTQPTTGKIYTKGRIASLLEVGTGFHPEMTGRENIFLNGAILGMRKHEIQRKLDEIIAFSGVERYIDTPVKRYSSGMYVRLAFAVAAHLESEILIVDEVLAVGDAEFQKKCLGKMNDVSKGEGRTVLFVSHNMAAVKSLCKTGITMEYGRVALIGNIDESISQYLKVNDISNSVIFADGPIRKVNVVQQGKDLIINAEYDSAVEIDIPNLGFAIYNEFGNPVIGGNPILHNFDFSNREEFLKGSIEVTVVNPRLVDGAYSMSIWFGNSRENFFESLECIMFEIKNMVEIKYVNTMHIGSVTPMINWKF